MNPRPVEPDVDTLPELPIDPVSVGPTTSEPSPEPTAPPPVAVGGGTAQNVECVALPTAEPRTPSSSRAASCAATPLESTPEALSASSDARPLLVGRWELCGDDAPFGQTPHAGLEFGGNGRVQLLERDGDALVARDGGPTGSFTLLASGQLMFRGALALDDYATFARFDPSFDALEFEAFGAMLRYARVAPDVASAATNVFSTSDSRCSMVGTWDTQSGSPNPAAAFAFDPEGEWIGGEYGSDLCAQHTMYGTYELDESGFHLVTNVGAGACDYWFDAYFAARFSDDCRVLTLEMTGDNCTGGRGYLDWPGEVLIRR